MASPYKNKTPATIDDKGGLKLELDNAGLNKSRFALYQYPVLIYNSQISSFITKDVLSEKENSLFAEHSILFLNRQEEELTSQIRNFGRSVIELLKPQGNIFKNGWVWIIVVIVAIILIAMFAPHIMQVINGGAGQAVAKTIQQTAASTSQTITPLN
jgi:ATP-dependent Zn protease